MPRIKRYDETKKKGFLKKIDLVERIPYEEEAQEPFKGSDRYMSLIVKDKPKDGILFHYNPTTWDDSRSTKYSDEDASEWNGTVPQYDKTGKRTISFTLFLDDSSSIYKHSMMRTRDVIEWLRQHSMTLPDAWDEPPVLLFTGARQHYTFKLFTCVIKNVNVKPLILEKLNPWDIKRAEVSISLDEYLESPA